MRERGVYGARNALASIDVVHQVAPNDLAGRGRQPEAPLASREGVEGEAAAAGGARRAEAPDDVATVVVQCCEEGFEGDVVLPLARGAQSHECRHHVGMPEVRAEHNRVPPDLPRGDGAEE